MAREVPDAAFTSRYVADSARRVRSVDGVWSSTQLVPVTTWVHPDLLGAAPPYRAPGRVTSWPRRPYALGGLVIAVAVVAALAACLVIALLALVAWVSAHAVAVGVGAAAVAGTALLFVRALTPARRVRPCEGWRHECE